MNKTTIVAGLLCLMLVAAVPVIAQVEPISDTPDKAASGEPPGSITFTEGCSTITDDAYDGSIASMTCLTVPGTELIIDDVNVNLGVDHTWIGDLTIKVVSPTGTISTLQSRTGFAETGDDGTGCCGDSSDIATAFPVTYDDASTNDAELMGSTILGGDVVCQADGICDYFPNPDTGPGVNLADFNGEDGTGDWMVCVGDSALGDVGQICSAEVLIEGTGVPTVPWQGLLLLIAFLSVVSLAVMRRKAHSS